VRELAARVELLHARHTGELELAAAVPAPAAEEAAPDAGAGSKRETAIRPERFARLVTLASILIQAGRAKELLPFGEVCQRLQVSDAELREDINVLNVVNFGGGSYVLYADIRDDGMIDVDPEPYSDNFDRPARLLPVEAKALVAAIDLIGDHLPEGQLNSARAKIVEALGTDPAADGLQITSAIGDDSQIARVVSEAIEARRLIVIDYYKENEDVSTSGRKIEPYFLMNGQEGWYVHSWDPAKDDSRSFRLDRIKSVEVLDETYEPRPGIEPPLGWARTGVVPASRRARVWMSPERARWAREQRGGGEDLADGALIFELAFAGEEWLAGEILKEAGDAAVLEPEDARAAVLEAAEALTGAVKS
jgi:predicted DNA-binding transcriptional regulator YafY